MAYDRAGSISLKSTLPMDYSRAVLSNKWHQKRESEPVDFPLWSGDKPNLQRSTYKLLAKNIPSDKISNDTETRSEHEKTLRILEELRRPDVARPMIDEANRDRLDQLLDKYPAEKKVIKTHQSGHDQHHLETTNRRDFVNFNPQFGGQKSLKAQQVEAERNVDNSFAFRKMISQFTDLDAPKRENINTFCIQTGDYGNQQAKDTFNARNKNTLFVHPTTD